MNNLIAVALLLFLWPFSAKEYVMSANKKLPAAAGKVKVEKDKANGNTKLEITVEHLANPSSLTPAASSYIVWVRPNGATDAIKQGAIRVGKGLEGKLKIVTVSKDFDLFITAEQSDIVSVPSDFEVLETHVTL